MLFLNVIQKQLSSIKVLIEIWLLLGNCSKVNMCEHVSYQVDIKQSTL